MDVTQKLVGQPDKTLAVIGQMVYSDAGFREEETDNNDDEYRDTNEIAVFIGHKKNRNNVRVQNFEPIHYGLKYFLPTNLD